MKNKKILVIGASSGIGEELSKHFLSKKNTVFVCSRNIEKLKKIYSKYENSIITKVDVLKPKQVNSLKKKVKKKFSTIDALICCQGKLDNPSNLVDSNKASWLKIFKLNFLSNYEIMLNFYPLIKKNNFSNIIFFSGGGSFNEWNKFSSYSCSKTALVRMVENLAVELLDKKIMVNCIAPGFIPTAIHDKNFKNLSKLNKKYKYELIKKYKNRKKFNKVISLANFLLDTKKIYLTGRTLSANFDKWYSKKFLTEIKKNNNFLKLRRENIK